MRSILFIGFTTISSCVMPTQSNSRREASVILNSWPAEKFIDYRGDYFGEDFSGSVSLHLWPYYDRQYESYRYAAFLIVAEDFMAKPAIETIYDLETESGVLRDCKTKQTIIEAVKFSDGAYAMKFKGLIMRKQGEPGAVRY
jgi:hypothetical protein